MKIMRFPNKTCRLEESVVINNFRGRISFIVTHSATMPPLQGIRRLTTNGTPTGRLIT